MWAIIFKPWADEPVFHALMTSSLTTCGRRIGERTPCLPMKHVVKFARPCRGCYPEGWAR